MLWQWTAATFTSVLPPLQDIVADIAERPEFYVENLMVTIRSAMTGLLIGVVVAVENLNGTSLAISYDFVRELLNFCKEN